jgi:hypothetical protein
MVGVVSRVRAEFLRIVFITVVITRARFLGIELKALHRGNKRRWIERFNGMIHLVLRRKRQHRLGLVWIRALIRVQLPRRRQRLKLRRRRRLKLRLLREDKQEGMLRRLRQQRLELP